MRALLPAEAQALVQTAADLSVPVEWLAGLIAFETAGTMSPTIKNPYSGFQGLIQFGPGAAQDLGFADQGELVRRYPDFVSQLRGPVLSYLRRYAPFPSWQALALAVFYPSRRYADPEVEFSEQVQAQNPGIRTVGDYARLAGQRIADAGRAVAAALETIDRAIASTIRERVSSSPIGSSLALLGLGVIVILAVRRLVG